MYRILFIIAILFASYGIMRAQDFSYTVSTDSVAWNELNAQTILNTNNAAWNFSYRVPIGFSFPFAGRNFDSLTIETNGYIVLDNDRNYAITAFSGIGDCTDGNGDHAVLGYELTGTTGNHILKIQYKNCSDNPHAHRTLSWQVWLKEDGDVEVRVGPAALRSNAIVSVEYNEQTELMDTTTTVVMDSSQVYRIGLLNMNMDSDDRGLLLGDNPSSPDAEHVNENNPETPFLVFIPAVGYRYVFTPSN